MIPSHAELANVSAGTCARSSWSQSMHNTVCCLQLMSLLRDYDVTWPSSTIQLLSYADSLNLGISITAPQCFVPGYNFFVFYIATMAQPVRLFSSDLASPDTTCVPRCAVQPVVHASAVPSTSRRNIGHCTLTTGVQ